MGLDYEILDEQYNKILSDKNEIEGRADLSDEERESVLAGFDGALSSLENSILELATETKNKMQALIDSLEKKISVNEQYMASAEKELALRQAELEEEMAKENPDQGIIEAKQSEINALEKRIKSLKSATKKVQKEIKEQKKLLIPIMKRFGEKIFTAEEISDLEKLDKKVQKGKELAEKRNKKAEEKEVEKEDKEEVEKEEEIENVAPVVDEIVIESADVITAEEPAVEDRNASTTETVVGGPFVAEPTVVTTDKVKSFIHKKEDFNKIYEKAYLGKLLTDKDYDTLAEIMSNPEEYDHYGITTGRIFNKGRVLLAAMGKYIKESSKDTIGAARDIKVFNDAIATGKIVAEEKSLTPTNSIDSWKGIKKFMKKTDVRFASEEILDQIISEADGKIDKAIAEDGKIAVHGPKESYLVPASGVIGNIKNAAIKQQERIASFKDITGVYQEVRKERGQKDFKLFGFLGRKNKNLELPEATPVEYVALKEDKIEEKEPEEKGVIEEVLFERAEGEYVDLTDSFASTLKDRVVPIEEVAAEVVEEKPITEKEKEIDFGPDFIDG